MLGILVQQRRVPVGALVSREVVTMPPTDRWKAGRPSPEDIDFARESATAFEPIAGDAAVAFEIGLDNGGNFIDALTGAPNPRIVDTYSRMKHGDLDGVSFFAAHIAAIAMQTERFLSLNRQAVANERVIYITTAAVFNVPSASNLLLRATAARLNIMLTKKGYAPVVVDEQIRLSNSPLGYSSKTVRERRDGLAAGRGVTLVPEYFRDQSLVFLDDLFSTGYTVYRAERRLRKVNVADRFYLFAARMDPQAVGSSHGQIEDRLNDHIITGTLESVAPILKGGNFAVVQKLVKVTLDPKHTARLADFLVDVPTSAILKVYAAAASDGFRERRQRCYFPSLVILERVLEERGALDAEGHIIGDLLDVTALQYGP
jgi:hypothetical protein